MPDNTLDQKIQDAILALPEGTQQHIVDATVDNVTTEHNMLKAQASGNYAGNIGLSATHVAKAGDTLSQIAKDYDTTVEKIAEHNKIKNVNEIKEGQVLDMSFAIAL